MKALYLLSMFTISSAMGAYYGYAARERTKTLKELVNFFKYLVIKISAKDGSLQTCVNTYFESPKIENFLAALTEHLECGCLRPFEPASKALSILKPDEREVIKRINIGSLDYAGQIKSLEQAICNLEIVLDKEDKETKKTNTLSYSGVLVGIALVIIFI